MSIGFLDARPGLPPVARAAGMRPRARHRAGFRSAKPISAGSTRSAFPPPLPRRRRFFYTDADALGPMPIPNRRVPGADIVLITRATTSGRGCGTILQASYSIACPKRSPNAARWADSSSRFSTPRFCCGETERLRVPAAAASGSRWCRP